MQAACDNLELGSYINVQSKIPHAPPKEGSCCQGSLKLVGFSDAQPRQLHWQCFDCFLSFTLRSQPRTRCTGPLFPTKGRGYNHSALVQVLSIAINDFVYSKYALHQVLVGLPAIPKSTFQDIAHKIVWPEIIVIAEGLMEAARKRACARDERFPVILCCDAGWAHRGFHLKQSCLPVIDFFSGDVLGRLL